MIQFPEVGGRWYLKSESTCKRVWGRETLRLGALGSVAVTQPVTVRMLILRNKRGSVQLKWHWRGKSSRPLGRTGWITLQSKGLSKFTLFCTTYRTQSVGPSFLHFRKSRLWEDKDLPRFTQRVSWGPSLLSLLEPLLRKAFWGSQEEWATSLSPARPSPWLFPEKTPAEAGKTWSQELCTL